MTHSFILLPDVYFIVILKNDKTFIIIYIFFNHEDAEVFCFCDLSSCITPCLSGKKMIWK